MDSTGDEPPFSTFLAAASGRTVALWKSGSECAVFKFSTFDLERESSFSERPFVVVDDDVTYVECSVNDRSRGSDICRVVGGVSRECLLMS